MDCKVQLWSMIGTFALLLYANHFLKKQILFGQEKKHVLSLFFTV